MLLAAPNLPATVIRRFRGKVPVIAVARGFDSMVIPLKDEGVLGRPYSTRDLTLVVDEVLLAPGVPASVKVTVCANHGNRGVREPRPARVPVRCVQLRRSPPAFGIARRGRPAHQSQTWLTEEEHRRRHLRVDRRAPLRERCRRPPGGLEGTHSRRAALLLFRRDGDGNSVRFPRHPRALSQAGALPMSIVPLVLFVALAAAPAAAAEPDPTALVAKLGSAEPAERAAATESLKSLGRVALPALQHAMKESDANIRERASLLWETIQRELMTRPSMVQLIGENRPLSAVLADLETQTGLTLQREQSAPDAVVALGEPALVTLWTALERLGLGGIYYHNPGEGRFPKLLPCKAPAPAFTSTNGPFRVSLRGLHLHRDRQLIRGPWVRIDRNGQWIFVPSEELKGETVTFFGGLSVMVEPRMWFTQERLRGSSRPATTLASRSSPTPPAFRPGPVTTHISPGTEAAAWRKCGPSSASGPWSTSAASPGCAALSR